MSCPSAVPLPRTGVDLSRSPPQMPGKVPVCQSKTYLLKLAEGWIHGGSSVGAGRCVLASGNLPLKCAVFGGGGGCCKGAAVDFR